MEQWAVKEMLIKSCLKGIGNGCAEEERWRKRSWDCVFFIGFRDDCSIRLKAGTAVMSSLIVETTEKNVGNGWNGIGSIIVHRWGGSPHSQVVCWSSWQGLRAVQGKPKEGIHDTAKGARLHKTSESPTSQTNACVTE